MDDTNVEQLDNGKWLFVIHRQDEQLFDTEDEACEAQREYRKQHGFDEITGNKL